MKKLIIALSILLFLILTVILTGPDRKKAYLIIKKDDIPSKISVGDSFNITLDTNLNKNNIQYKVSDNSIIFINNEGLATVLKKGTATIEVTTVYEDKRPLKDTIKIVVKN